MPAAGDRPTAQPTQALADLRVIEYGDFIAPAYAGKLLADLGAEVLKIEPPRRGDSLRRHGPFPDDVPDSEKSGLFLYLNANKLGITLDPTTATGREIFLRLVADADVLIENHRPGWLASLGLGYETLAQRNPRLIVTSITPYGQTGPYRDAPAYDITVCALGGIAVDVGEPGRAPLTPPLYQSEYQGGIGGAAATLTALLARNRTGRGQHADVATTELFSTIHSGGAAPTFVFLGPPPGRQGHRRADLYPYTILPCKDGYVCLIAREGQQWKRFLQAIGWPAWADNPRYRDRRIVAEQYPDEMDQLVLQWLMQHTKEEIFALCRAHRVPFAPLRTADEILADPALAERGYWLELDHPVAGRLRYPGAPYKLSATPWACLRPAPLLGQHNAAIYCGRLGYSRQELVTLYRTGVI
jgi:crotonobetainyl-CoA:carnitine CoA-transferase CaiB-like acyl-CoA transferase